MHAAAGAGHVNVVRLLLEAENRIELIPQPLERVKSAASMFSATSSMSRVSLGLDRHPIICVLSSVEAGPDC